MRWLARVLEVIGPPLLAVLVVLLLTALVVWRAYLCTQGEGDFREAI